MRCVTQKILGLMYYKKYVRSKDSLGFHQLGILRIVPNFCVEKPKLP